MYEHHPTHDIVRDIQSFIVDYVEFIAMINDRSWRTSLDLFTVKLSSDKFFLFPAIWNRFSQRARTLQIRLQEYIRVRAQVRRCHQAKHIETNAYSSLTITEQDNPLLILNMNLTSQLEQLQNSQTDAYIHPIVGYLRRIVDALQFYNETIEIRSIRNQIFRLLPILRHIQQQV
jgi:hypothetical protein